MFKKTLALVLSAILLCACFASCSNGTSRKGEGASLLPAPTLTKDFEIPAEFKIGVICLHDENSTYDYNFLKAIREVKKILGLSDSQVLEKNNVPEGNECYETAKELVSNGCKIVFADSFGHEPYMVQAAKEYPDVQFCHATGTSASYKNKELANFHNAFAAIYEGRYLAGIAAGLKLNEMISNGKIKAEQAIIGYVGAFTYAEVISGMTSFYLGAKSVCPSATMKVRYTGSWYDQGKEQEAAETLMNQDGCVLISQHADSLGAPTACQNKGVPNVSYNGSTYSAGKDTFLISSAINWQPYFLYIIKSVCQGTPIADDWTGTIATGSVILSGMNLDVIAEGTETAVKNAIDGFKNGTLHVFDTSKFTVKGANLTEYLADVDGDFQPDTNVIHDGYFDESGEGFRSAPYFDIIIDGVTNLNENFGD